MSSPIVIGPPAVAMCQMTRAELQRRLQESAFGRNEVIYFTFFRRDDNEPNVPRCSYCGDVIQRHRDEQIQTAPPTLAGPPPPSAAAQPVLQGLLLDSPPVQGQVIHYSNYQPPSGLAMPRHLAVVPNRLVQQPTFDSISEGFPIGALIVAAVLAFFCVSSFIATLGLRYTRDNSETERRSLTDLTWSIISTVMWAMAAAFVLYSRCVRFRTTLYKGHKVECIETRLLLYFWPTTTSLQWSQAIRTEPMMVRDSTAVLCCCCPPSWHLLILQSTDANTGRPVIVKLCRVEPGLAEFECRQWWDYLRGYWR